MKKSDLVSGRHVVETKDGERYLVAGGWLPHIYDKGFTFLSNYTESLSRVTCFEDESEKWDICRVYEIIRYNSLGRLYEYTNTLKLVWERKPELSEAERIILENVDKKYKWIARDGYIEEEGMRAELGLFEDRPIRMNNYWSGTNCASFAFFNNLFKMVKWEDEEPTLIADLLGE